MLTNEEKIRVEVIEYIEKQLSRGRTTIKIDPANDKKFQTVYENTVAKWILDPCMKEMINSDTLKKTLFHTVLGLYVKP